MVAKRRRTRQPSANRSSSPNRPPPSGRADNLLLAALPQADRARLDRALDVIPLKLKDLLHKPGERIQHVYFPAGGSAPFSRFSRTAVWSKWPPSGVKALVGVAATLDGDHAPSVTMVQAEADTCYRMTAEMFRREMDQRGDFYEDHPLRTSAARLRDAVDGLQCRALGRATAGAMAPDGARPGGSR
jgi:hypothetical protein